MKKFGILAYLCVLMLLVTTLSYAQDLNAIQQKMLELQTYYMNALQFQQQKEFLKAAREYEKAVLTQIEMLKMAQGFPEFQKSMIYPIVDTTANIAYCYKNAHDLENARKYYADALGMAQKYSYVEKVFEIMTEVADMCRDSYDYENFHELQNKIVLAIREAKAIKAIDELLAMSGDAKSCMLSIRALNKSRNLALTRCELLYEMNKYDEVLKSLDDPELIEEQRELAKINLEQLDILCKKYKQHNKTLEPEMLVLFYTVNMDNIVRKFLTITEKGMCYRSKENYDKALSLFDEAEKVIKSIDLEEQKKLVDAIYGELKTTASALKPENQALIENIFKSFREDSLAELITILYVNNKYHRARTYQKTNDHTRALELFSEIRKECEKLPYYKQYILPKIDISMAESHYALKSYDRADESAQRAQKGLSTLHESLNVPIDDAYAWKIENLRGKLAETRGEREKALDAYRKSISHVEKLRTCLGIEYDLEEFFGERTEPYEGSIRILTEAGKKVEALQNAEKVKARSLSQLLSMTTFIKAILDEVKKKDSAAAGKIENRIHEWSSYEANLKEMQNSNKPMNKEEVSALRQKIDKCRDDVIEMLGAATNVYCPYLRDVLDESKIISPDEAQKLLDKDTAVLEYFSDTASDKEKQKSYCWVLTSDTIEEFPLSIPPAQLDNSVREFRKDIAQTGESWKEHSAELYKVLIKPCEKLISGKARLLIIPHKSLHYLPFAALLDEQGLPLARKYSIINEPSLTGLAMCRGMKSQKGQEMIVFALGNVSPEGGLSPLPGTLTEADDIKRIYPKATVIKEKDFTREAVEEKLKNKNLVHFATHGVVDADHPYDSGLVTSTGKWTVQRLMGAFSSDLKLDLIALSACNTGIGKLFPGDDQVGLTRALMKLGSPSILSSLWSVSDESTAKLMTHFYENLHENMDKGEALREAELKLMDEFPHPFYWAPFVLSGDWK